MSKKHRRYAQKKTFPWLLLTFGGFFILIAIFLFARQDGDDGGGTPSISVDQQRIDFGNIQFGVTKSFAVKVTNTGDGRLRFKDEPYIEVLEGC